MRILLEIEIPDDVAAYHWPSATTYAQLRARVRAFMRDTNKDMVHSLVAAARRAPDRPQLRRGGGARPAKARGGKIPK